MGDGIYKAVRSIGLIDGPYLCVCSGPVAISTWYAAVVVSIGLGFVYLVKYPSRMIRRLFCKTEFWYCVVLVRGTMIVAMDAGRDGVVRVFKDTLDDVDGLFVQKVLHGLDVVHSQGSVCGYSDNV